MACDSTPDPGAYDFDLGTKLETTIDLYQQDRAMYWQSRHGTEDWTPLKQLQVDADEIALLIRKRALSLQNHGEARDLNGIHNAIEDAKVRLVSHLQTGIPDPVKEALLQEVLKAGLFHFLDSAPSETARGCNISDSPMKLIWERLWIEDAWDTVSGIQERAYRVWELERLVESIFHGKRPPELCTRFLALISRCYLFGLTPECVAMCRAGMEQAFRDRVTEEHCRRAGQPHDKLRGLIDAAFDRRNAVITWDPELYKAAKEVLERGNKALHYDPDVTTDALGTVDCALRVIAALSPPDQGHGYESTLN